MDRIPTFIYMVLLLNSQGISHKVRKLNFSPQTKHPRSKEFVPWFVPSSQALNKHLLSLGSLLTIINESGNYCELFAFSTFRRTSSLGLVILVLAIRKNLYLQPLVLSSTWNKSDSLLSLSLLLSLKKNNSDILHPRNVFLRCPTKSWQELTISFQYTSETILGHDLYDLLFKKASK